jgi:hypothetical protein
MVTDEVWKAKVRNVLRAQLKLQDIGYRELAERLAKIGVKESEQNLANKFSRGSFSAVFLFQVAEAIGKKITISDP